MYTQLQNLILITGGAKSGKSEFAESMASQRQTPVVYLATAHVSVDDSDFDPEWQERIRRHQQRRPPAWKTVELGGDTAFILQHLPEATEGVTYLLDCLSLYIASLLYEREADWQDANVLEAKVLDRSRVLLALFEQRQKCQFIVVTSEVGSGLVPDNLMGRRFQDALGLVNQEFARHAQAVWLICSGLPLKLK